MEFLANKHNIVIHFPIAFLVFYIFLEVLNLFLKKDILQKISLFTLLIGVLGGVAAVLTGNLEFQILLENSNISEMHKYLISEHEEFATITMWYFLVILITRYYLRIKKRNGSLLRYLFVIFGLIGFYFVYKTAQLGGILVYKYGIGTKLLE